MKGRFFVLVFILGLPSTINAGFSDSPKDTLPFKCGREDAINALTVALRDNAMSRSRIFVPPERIDFFQNQVENIPVNISGVSTTGEYSSQELRCVATVSMTIPFEVRRLAHEAPEVFSEFVRESYGLYKNGNITWNDVSYQIRLADNKKDISVALKGAYYSLMSLAKASYLAITKDDIVKQNNPSRLAIAKQAYEVEDARLNKIWKTIPASLRKSMKDEQISWINNKAHRCNYIELVNDVNLSTATKTRIYECQAEMTKARIKYLSEQQ